MPRPLTALGLLGALGLFTALTGACGRDASVSAFAPELREVHGGGPWVEPQLNEAVEAARWLRPETRADVPALPLTIEIMQLQGPENRPVLRLVAEVAPPPEWRPRLGAQVDAVVEVEPAEGAIDPERHGSLALDRALAVLDAKLGLALEGRGAIEPILRAADPQIVVLGLDWITDHRAREHADAVAALVEHADERVALRALECLAVVGESRHARALVRLPRLADRAYAQRFYDALARLGGEDARGFLEFAVRNEDDPVMVEVAADALSRMEDGDDTKAAQVAEQPRGHR